MSNGFTGLAFPLRLNNQGGLKLTTTSSTDFTHIEESIKQILMTSVGERIMEVYFGSQVSTHIFDPTDESTFSLIKHEIVEVLTQYEPRVSVTTSGISMYDKMEEETGKNFLFVSIQYVVLKYNREGSLTVNLGGVD